MARCKDVDHNNETSLRLNQFCKKLVRQSQWKCRRVLFGGSRMENHTHILTAQMLKISLDKLDADKMMYVPSKCVVSRSQSVPESYTGEIVRIYNTDTHAGYVTLIKEKDNAELLWADCIYHAYRKEDGDPIKIRHGPAIQEIYEAHKIGNSFKFSNPIANIEATKELAITPQDRVFTVHSPYWPVEAAEWITRKRARYCLSKPVINEVIRYGCDFVQISHKLGDIHEWRFSFSKGELLIIKSWTISQRNVYTVLWSINKQCENSHMCSYYFKTLMLWACEEKPLEFWNDEILVSSVRELLIYMMTCLKSNFCPNYFITANNMMDHLIGIDLSRDIEVLFKEINSNDIFQSLSLSDMLQKSSNRESFELPAWIKRAFLIYERINYEEDNFTDLYNSTFEPRVLNALEVELVDIYNGLNCQKVETGCDSISVKSNYLLMSQQHFTRAFSAYKSDKIETLDNCNHVLVRSFTNVFITAESNKNPLLLALQRNDNNGTAKTSPTFTDTDTSLGLKNGAQKRSINFQSRHNFMLRFSINGSFAVVPVPMVILYREWPGVSPTVNISWFVAKAYLANLYYMNRVYHLTMETCDDIIDVYRHTYTNERYAERTFPVVLSTRWVSIYDKEIQELIGFYTLCKYVWTRANSRSVCLGVCPVLFAHYIKTRTEPWNVVNIEKYNDHQHNCQCDQRVGNGKHILYHAICNDPCYRPCTV